MGKIEHYKWLLLRSKTTRQMETKGCTTVLVYIICVILLSLTSCKTIKYVPVKEVHTDTIYQSKIEKDSVWLHDSVYVKEYMKGDTVFQIKMQWRDRWRERIQIDTLYQSKTDSIPVPYKVEVEKKLTAWQKAKVDFGGYAIIVCLGALVIFIIRLYLRR